VLGPEPTRIVTDDANMPLERVDTLIREKDGNIYVFAARVTEPDPIPQGKYQGVEPESITVRFIISNIVGNVRVDVIDEGRTITMTDGRLTDTFESNAVHIYKIGSHHFPSQLPYDNE